MNQLISFVESKLVWFVIFVAGLGLAIPETGQFLEPGIGPLLAFLMFIISLTFDAHDVRTVLRKPSRQFLALGLVYGPMSIAGWLTGRLFFGSGPLAAGQTLLGTLPTDVSSPLLVLWLRYSTPSTQHCLRSSFPFFSYGSREYNWKRHLDPSSWNWY
jgi:BASS family bile acid:Na+ symporter